MEAKNMKKQDLCDTLQKSVRDKVPNVTDEEMNRKYLSCFLRIVNWLSIKPEASPSIEPDSDS